VTAIYKKSGKNQEKKLRKFRRWRRELRHRARIRHLQLHSLRVANEAHQAA
jgi:hypothetical protein